MIVPIAGPVITYVLCYELIMVTEKTICTTLTRSCSLQVVSKPCCRFLVTHTFDITMAVFDMAQHIVSSAAGL